jgi:hypothetical protein
MKLDQAQLEKQVATLTAEREEYKAKQCALEQMVDKERKATETAKAALEKQVTAMTEQERKSLDQYAWARINHERILIRSRWETRDAQNRLWEPIRMRPVESHRSWIEEESDEYE